MVALGGGSLAVSVVVLVFLFCLGYEGGKIVVHVGGVHGWELASRLLIAHFWKFVFITNHQPRGEEEILKQ